MNPAVLRGTLLLIILYGVRQGDLSSPTDVVACCLLVVGQWLRSRLGWVLLAVLLTHSVTAEYLTIDNHQFLLVYWVWAICLVIVDPRLRSVLDCSAQQLLGLTFLFAAFWKLWGGEYFDGTFWEYRLLTDPRTAEAAMVLGGLNQEAILANRIHIGNLLDGFSNVAVVQLGSTPRLEGVARWTGRLGALLESVIAVLFLLPLARGPWTDAARLAAIGVFLLVYWALPIPGFAWTLVLLTLGYLPLKGWAPARAGLVVLAAMLVMSPWLLTAVLRFARGLM